MPIYHPSKCFKTASEIAFRASLETLTKLTAWIVSRGLSRGQNVDIDENCKFAPVAEKAQITSLSNFSRDLIWHKVWLPVTYSIFTTPLALSQASQGESEVGG
jgi:hypothetical protein